MSSINQVEKAIVMARIRLAMLQMERANLMGNRVAETRCSNRLFVLERQRQQSELCQAEASALNEMNGGHVDA